MPGARTRCYAENEADYVLWGEVQEADCSICKSIEPFKEHKFNKTLMEQHRFRIFHFPVF